MGPAAYGDEQVDLFDDVFGLLIEEIETKARAELSNRLAPVEQRAGQSARTLANDDDISVAGPVLKLAPRLPESDLIDVARTKSQAHLAGDLVAQGAWRGGDRCAGAPRRSRRRA
jgi:uncharacterized protein (DUF2336 family)